METGQTSDAAGPTDTTPRILVVGPAWVGDMVMAQSLFKLLRERMPEVAIDVLAPAWSRPLLARMPEVRQAIVMPLGHGELGLQTRFRLGRALRSKKYDQAIVLPNSFKSALTPFWAGIPRRTGFKGELRRGLLNDVRILDKQRLPRMIDRFATLGLGPDEPLPARLPVPALRVRPDSVAVALERQGVESTTEPIMGLCPGAQYGPAKRWPVSYFAEIARAKLASGWRVWIFGSSEDAPLCRQIDALTGNACRVLAGKTDLAEAVDLLSLTSGVVSNDSGLMHVAAALGRELVVVYGSSTPDFTPPLSEQARTVSLALSCSPCFKRRCPLGHTNCLNDLPPERVLAALDRKAA